MVRYFQVALAPAAGRSAVSRESGTVSMARNTKPWPRSTRIFFQPTFGWPARATVISWFLRSRSGLRHYQMAAVHLCDFTFPVRETGLPSTHHRGVSDSRLSDRWVHGGRLSLA